MLASRPARAIATFAAALIVAGSAGGCRVDRPGADTPGAAPAPSSHSAVADPSPGRPADPLADLDTMLDAVEDDLDASAAEG